MDNREFLCFTIGACTGAALGVLFAPKAGAETRQQVAHWSDQTRGKLKEYGEVASDRFKDATHRAQDYASSMTHRAQEYASSLNERVKGIAEEAELRKTSESPSLQTASMAGKDPSA